MLNQFIRFFIVGAGATIIHLLLYLIINRVLHATEQTPLLLTFSYATGYFISFIVNYEVSLKWTFRTQGSTLKGVGFAFSHLINASMHVLLLNVFRSMGLGKLAVLILASWLPWLVELWPWLGKSESLLPLPIYCIVVPINFLMVRFSLTQINKESHRNA